MEGDWHKNICQEALLWTSCYRIYETAMALSSWNMIIVLECNPLAVLPVLCPGLLR
jgi:hypothetical protein